MARGVFLDVRHGSTCPAGKPGADPKDPYSCRCSPRVRARVAGKWVEGLSVRLDVGWRKRDLNPIETAAAARKQEHDTGRQRLAPGRTPTLTVWGERWIKDLERRVMLGEYTTTTHLTYRSAWSNHIDPVLGQEKLTAIGLDEVDALRQKMVRAGLSRDYVQLVSTVLGLMLGDAVPRYLTHNPVVLATKRRRGTKPPEVRKRDKLMPRDVADAILATTTGHLHEQILCGLTTGMRKMELAGLTIERVDFSARRIYVDAQADEHVGERPPKGNKLRVVPMCQGLHDALMVRAEQVTAGPLWSDPTTGLPYTRGAMTERFNDAWEAVATRPPRHSWHVLRHTFATMLDRARVREVVVDQIMGHSNPSVRNIYQHAMDEEYAIVVDVLDRAWAPQLVDVTTPQAETQAST